MKALLTAELKELAHKPNNRSRLYTSLHVAYTEQEHDNDDDGDYRRQNKTVMY